MKKVEYEKFKEHILGSMDIEDLKANLQSEKTRCYCDCTYTKAKQMVQDGFFECYYAGVIEVLKDIYGDDFKEDVYFTKDGELRWKNDECYCWTVYKHKIALTIETMEKKGELK